MRHRLALLLALAAATAGCLGVGDPTQADGESVDPAATNGTVDVEAVSPPVHELDRMVETWLPSHDGTELHTAEYHPDVEGETPVVIQLSPYFGNGDSEPQAQHDSYWTDLLVERGYTVVHASVRGTGYSGGCFQLGGPDEVQDAGELVEHYHQAEWSNGNVSLIGVSYPGTTPWQAAIEDPEGLQTIVPISGISDMYRYDHVNGASYTHGPLFPTYYTALVDGTLVPRNADDPRHVLGPIEAACPGAAERVAEGYRTGADGNHDGFWDEREYEARVDDIDVPVFLVHGFQDWNVDPDNGVPVFDELPNGSKAWLGQWAHNVPFANTYNGDWERHDWNLTLVAWFDEHLKGKDTGVTDEPAVLAQTSRGDWHREQAWPPEDTARERLFLAEDGLQETPGEATTATVGPWTGPSPGEAVPDAAREPQPDQALVFETEPLEEETVLVGRPTVTLNVSVDQPGGHLVADLYDLDAEGTVDEPSWLGHAIQRLEHRDSRDEGEPMPIDEPQTVALEFFPMDARVPEGHRLALELSPEDPSWIHPSPYEPTYRFQLGGDEPASLAFDVLEDPTFEEAPEQGEVPWST